MDLAAAEEHEFLIRNILDPKHGNARAILNVLGLDGTLSRTQVHSQIERKLLLPQKKLPDHWLPTYQM